ncbi:MAG: hypothetical protein M3Y87_15785 [Myxococcota bacterium]|nr:hypothetical protein [Myxococcota bacterium]
MEPRVTAWVERGALLATLSTLVVLAGPGCGTATSTTGDAGEPDAPYVEATCTPDPSDTFCPEYAAEYCRAHFACCDDPALQYGSMSLCEQRTTCECTARRAGASFEDGRIVLDQVAADALLARLRDESSGTCAVRDASQVELDTVFTGTLPEGGDCSPSGTDYSPLFTCSAGLYCYVTDFGSETTPPQADCRRYRAAGETCDIGMECGPGLYCQDGPTIDDPGSCAPHVAAGAACEFDHECGSDWCDEDLGTCRALDAHDAYCVDPDDFEE